MDRSSASKIFFFFFFPSRLALIGDRGQALLRVMACKWVETVNSVWIEKRQSNKMSWGKSFDDEAVWFSGEIMSETSKRRAKLYEAGLQVINAA